MSKDHHTSDWIPGNFYRWDGGNTDRMLVNKRVLTLAFVGSRRWFPRRGVSVGEGSQTGDGLSSMTPRTRGLSYFPEVLELGKSQWHPWEFCEDKDVSVEVGSTNQNKTTKLISLFSNLILKRKASRTCDERKSFRVSFMFPN